MTTDCNSRYIYLDPEIGGKIAVAEAARNIVCSGAEPLAITDCLNFGNPEKPEVFWQIEKAADGMSEACRSIKNTSYRRKCITYIMKQVVSYLSNTNYWMVGLVEDINHITTQSFKNAGDLIYLVGETKAEFGGSELQKLMDGKFLEKHLNRFRC